MYVDINIKMPLEYFGMSKEDLIDLFSDECWCWNNLINVFEKYSDDRGCICDCVSWELIE